MIRKKGATVPKYVRPKPAEKKFRLAQGLRQSVYIYGPTGIGKTAFVSDMLGRKSYHYYSVVNTGADEIFAAADGRQDTVVIDDLQEITGEQRRKEYAGMLRRLLQQKNIWLILISRCALLQWLMSLHVDSTFLIIREEELLLDRSGQDAYFEKWCVSLSAEQAKQIWQIGGGNPLFLRFVALAGGDADQAVNDMWKYLMYLYDQWDADLQEFVMELSVVGRFDIRMAQIVTGRSNVRQLIGRALEMGSFLKEKDGFYEFHIMLNDPVRSILEKIVDADRLARIYYNAGHMYEIYEDLPNALKMYEAGGDRDSIFRLLKANARLNPASGHYYELRRYYFLLPEETIATSPVLMAGMSMLQSMLMNPEQSERWYQLLEQFASEHEGSLKREAKNRLLYLDIALPHRGTLHILELLLHAGALLKEGRAMLPEFSVTSNLPSLMNGGKDFCSWSRRDKELAATAGKMVEFVLGKYGKGLVSIALAESYFEKGMDSYEIAALAEKGQMQAEAGGKMEQVFVAVGILVWLSVLNGCAEDAQDMLESFRQRAETEAPAILANLRAFQCRVALYHGAVPQVIEWMEEAPDENKEFYTMERFRYLTKIRIYIQSGKYDKAYMLLQKMLYYATNQKREYVAMESMLLLAIVKYRSKKDGWEQMLQECITQAESYGFVRLFSREGQSILKLLKEGTFTWQNESFRSQVWKECEQMKRFYPAYLKEKMYGNIVLSENALNILRLQAEGYRTDQIAERLGITGNTVKYHNKETYRKLNVTSKAAAVNEAKNRGLI